MNKNTDNALTIIKKMHTAKTLEEGFKDVAENVVCHDWTKDKVVKGKEAVLEEIIRPSDNAFRDENDIKDFMFIILFPRLKYAHVIQWPMIVLPTVRPLAHAVLAKSSSIV